MKNNILCKKLNQVINEIEFKVKKDKLTQETIYGEIKVNKYIFSIKIYIENHSLVRTYFNFGKIIYNEKTLFYINKFNLQCPCDFVAYIAEDEDLMFKEGYLHILVNIRDDSENKVAKLIDTALNKLFSPSMKRIFSPLMDMLIEICIPNLSNMN